MSDPPHPSDATPKLIVVLIVTSVLFKGFPLIAPEVAKPFMSFVSAGAHAVTTSPILGILMLAVAAIGILVPFTLAYCLVIGINSIYMQHRHRSGRHQDLEPPTLPVDGHPRRSR